MGCLLPACPCGEQLIAGDSSAGSVTLPEGRDSTKWCEEHRTPVFPVPVPEGTAGEPPSRSVSCVGDLAAITAPGTIPCPLRSAEGGLSCLLLPVCHQAGAVPGSGSALALTLMRDAKSAEPSKPRPASSPRRHQHPAIWSR